MRLSGYFAVFGQWAEIRSQREGHFLERVQPGAFSETIRRDRDRFRVLFEHGLDPLVGGKPLGTVDQVRQDNKGAYYESELFDTTYVNELEPALRANQFGSSFRFIVTGEEFTARPARTSWNPRGLAERTVTAAKVSEFGPTIAPAYPAASASLRSNAEGDVPVRQQGVRLEEVDAELGRDPVTPVTLRRLRKAAKTSTEAASLLTALQRGDKVELRWHDESRGETFRSGRVVLKRRVALAPERSEKRSQRLYGDEEWWRLQDPDRDWWRLGPKPEPTWKL